MLDRLLEELSTCNKEIHQYRWRLILETDGTYPVLLLQESRELCDTYASHHRFVSVWDNTLVDIINMVKIHHALNIIETSDDVWEYIPLF